MSETWSVTNCGNPEHGPGMCCHRVTDAAGKVLLKSVDRATADTFASVPVLIAQVRALEADNAALLEMLRGVVELMNRGVTKARAVGVSLEFKPHPMLAAVLDGKPPGAALLAEMDGLRARVTVSEERASVLTTERNALLEQVRSLTEERDDTVVKLTSERSNLRARVAELEALFAKSETERGLAILAKQQHERAASLARDAALEEAEGAIDEAFEKDLDVSAQDVVRALKSQPGKRFVDAEEVRDVLSAMLALKPLGEGTFIEGVRSAATEAARLLGITLDGTKP